MNQDSTALKVLLHSKNALAELTKLDTDHMNVKIVLKDSTAQKAQAIQ